MWWGGCQGDSRVCGCVCVCVLCKCVLCRYICLYFTHMTFLHGCPIHTKQIHTIPTQTTPHSTKTKQAPIAEPIFPPELRKRPPTELTLPGPKATWYRPLSLASLLKIKSTHPGAKLITGNTEIGIEMKFKDARYPVLVAVTHVPELNLITVQDDMVTFGASVTLTQLLSTCKSLIASRPGHQTSVCRAIAEQLRWFAGNQIRNAASIGGNVCTASPISDLNPLWVASGAVFVVQGQGSGVREVAARDFFLGYRCVLGGCLLVCVGCVCGYLFSCVNVVHVSVISMVKQNIVHSHQHSHCIHNAKPPTRDITPTTPTTMHVAPTATTTSTTIHISCLTGKLTSNQKKC